MVCSSPRARRASSSLSFALALAALTPDVAAQQLVKLEAPDAQPFDQHGYAVDVRGTTVAVGSHLADGFGLFNTGAVYLYDRGGQIEKLEPIEPAQNDRFGLALALGDGLLAVSSRHSQGQPESGVVDLFERTPNGWVATDRLGPPTPQYLGHFGDALALSSEVLVVGSPNADAPLFNQGAAYVYRRGPHGLEFDALLVPDDAHPEQYFGVSCAAEGRRVVVGAHWDSATQQQAGAGYVFEHVDGRWAQTAKLVPPDLEANDDFGRAVSLSGNRLAIGMPAADEPSNGMGAVYVFVDADGAWVLEQKLQPLDPQLDHAFGRVLELEGDTLVVGAVDPLGAKPYGGAAYVFRRGPGGWTQEAKISSPAPIGTTNFASSLAVHGSVIVGGGYLDSAQGTDAGAAWAAMLPTR